MDKNLPPKAQHGGGRYPIIETGTGDEDDDQPVSSQKSVAESPCSSRLPRGGKTGILTRSTRNVSPLERAALCLKTLTCTASPMNRHANS